MDAKSTIFYKSGHKINYHKDKGRIHNTCKMPRNLLGEPRKRKKEKRKREKSPKTLAQSTISLTMASSLPWHPLLAAKPQKRLVLRPIPVPVRHRAITRAFRRSDFDGFTRRVKSGELLRDAWRSANDGFELFVYETRKTAERIDRRYDVSRRASAVAEAAADRARELDREFEITQRWRTFSLDFSRNLPRYRRQLSDFLDTPVGRSFATLFFVWFALSGWLFRILIFATWVLPFAGPLLIGAVANNLVIKGECPACRKQFVGYKNQTVRCASCGNIVWQPQGDFFSRGGKGPSSSSKSKSQQDIIDVEFEEK